MNLTSTPSLAFSISIFLILFLKDSYNIFSDNTFYHSYEEAFELGLQEGLKLIK